MDHVLEDYLFSRGFFVAPATSAATEAHPIEALVALAHFAEIRITRNPELACVDMVEVARRNLGCDVPAPFYRGFPQTVRELSPQALLFDQLIHYYITYGLRIFSHAGHSLFERDYARVAFAEGVEPKPFAIVTVEEAEQLLARDVQALLASTRPLNDVSYMVVRHFLMGVGWPTVACACKDTACRLLLDLRDPTLADLIRLPDVIRLVEWLLEQSYPDMSLNKLNLRNRDRKLLTQVLDRLFARGDLDVATCLEKRRAWVGLLHYVHYRPTCDEAQAFLDAVRGRTQRSAFSVFEKLVRARDVRGATEHLLATKGPSAVARNLAYLLARSPTQKDRDFVLDAALGTNKIVLAQLIAHFYHQRPGEQRIFRFVRFNRLHRHAETDREIFRRTTNLDDDTALHVVMRLQDALAKACYGTLGKVYADPALRNTALPLQEATSQGGFGTLPRGTRVPLPAHKKVRAFIYWERVDDIDLSCQGIDRDGWHVTEFSWRHRGNEFSNTKGITFSGDETSGWWGGSEYFDLEPAQFAREYPHVRYAVFCANVFTSRGRFSRCTCRAGYMIRDAGDSGQVFEPKTVKSSFVVDGDTSAVFLFAIDLVSNTFVWLNVAEDSSQRIAGEADLRFLLEYLDAASAISLHDFACMLATQVVDAPEEADIVFSDDELALREDQEQIRSRDIARIVELLNT